MGTWQGQVLSIFLFDLVVPDTVQIGYIEGLQGLVQLIFACLAGTAVDRLGPKHRNFLLRLSALYTAAMLATAGFCVIKVHKTWAWYSCCALFAVGNPLQTTTIESLFADSVATGNRVSDYTNKRLCELAGALAGPFLQMFLFWLLRLQDLWTHEALKIFMIGGILCGFVATILQLFMDQKDTLGSAS